MEQNKKVQIQFYCDAELSMEIKELSKRTNVPMSHYFREGLRLIIKQTKEKLGDK